MPSNFDTMQAGVFEQAKTLFGYAAAWVSVDGLASWTGNVLFKNPNESYRPGGTFQYDPYRYEMEYKAGDFPGLLERVESRGNPETVTIDGKEYHIRDITADFDGKTYRATLQPVADL